MELLQALEQVVQVFFLSMCTCKYSLAILHAVSDPPAVEREARTVGGGGGRGREDTHITAITTHGGGGGIREGEIKGQTAGRGAGDPLCDEGRNGQGGGEGGQAYPLLKVTTLYIHTYNYACLCRNKSSTRGFSRP